MNQSFDYADAFTRNIGIVSPEEQVRLRNSCVALAGLGGIGGLYAHGLARLGVGKFVLADGDTFETANFNRQMAGNLDTVGCNKARSVEQQILKINPHADITVIDEYLHEGNVDAFLARTDLVLDGIDTFAIPAHRMLMRKSREKKLPLIVASPLGFSAAVLVFSQKGMKADDYFAWNDNQSQFDQVVQFVLGLAPAGIHLKNVDLRYVDLDGRYGPSHIAACLQVGGVVLAESTRLLLGRPGGWCVPQYIQMDPYNLRLKTGKLRRGNRGFLQRLKRKMLLRKWEKIKSQENGCDDFLKRARQILDRPTSSRSVATSI